MRDLTHDRSGYRHFQVGQGGRGRVVQVELATVDRFQGHEADFVFLSIANDHATSFLRSVNRLNVAITRARYQRVIVGNRKKLMRDRSLLGQLASTEKWVLPLRGE